MARLLSQNTYIMQWFGAITTYSNPGLHILRKPLYLVFKNSQNTVRPHVKKWHHKLKHRKLLAKLAVTKRWEAICVDLIGSYTLKGKDKTQIDIMSITMINPATSWFEIVEMPISQLPELDVPMGTKEQWGKDTHIQSKQPYLLTSHQKE
jgi:hypothetical protein